MLDASRERAKCRTQRRGLVIKTPCPIRVVGSKGNHERWALAPWLAFISRFRAAVSIGLTVKILNSAREEPSDCRSFVVEDLRNLSAVDGDGLAKLECLQRLVPTE